MIVLVFSDYCEVVCCCLFCFFFDYIDGGVVVENIMNVNVVEFVLVVFCQCVLCGVGELMLVIMIFDVLWVMFVVLGFVGVIGMYVCCGEVQVVCVVFCVGILYILFIVLVCLIEEVVSYVSGVFWFQLYVLKDCGYMCNVLECVWVVGMKILVFIVDMLIFGLWYCDNCLGMFGLYVIL